MITIHYFCFKMFIKNKINYLEKKSSSIYLQYLFLMYNNFVSATNVLYFAAIHSVAHIIINKTNYAFILTNTYQSIIFIKM